VSWKISATILSLSASLSPLFLSRACLQRYSLHLSLITVRASIPVRRRSGLDVALERVGQTRRLEWPSIRRRNSADGPNHRQTSATGLARVAPRRNWLPLPVVRTLPPCCIAQPPPPLTHRLRVPPGCCLQAPPGPLPPAYILPSSKKRLHYAKSACCKRVLQVFQMFQKYIASASCGYCKSRSRCCTCCICYKCFR
jgi:hypothetical protein